MLEDRSPESSACHAILRASAVAPLAALQPITAAAT